MNGQDPDDLVTCTKVLEVCIETDIDGRKSYTRRVSMSANSYTRVDTLYARAPVTGVASGTTR